MNFDGRRHRHKIYNRIVWTVIFFMIANVMPILLGEFFMIADAIVATAATDDGHVIPQPPVVGDHPGCASSDSFKPPTPTLLQCYLHYLNLALHAQVFEVGSVYGEPCGPAYDHIKNKILFPILPKIRPLLSRG
ncbi:transmembrane protein, putative [Medicago truncatula]|uniref:Transmembrane protein, putative n=1 Tax=Medicago truncatula TaxID=3880 RepID=A0A072VDV6_MEDTR|nr:transmembrane protein, putative [Medicago truncatula]